MEYRQKIQGQVQQTTLSVFSRFCRIWLGRISPLNKYIQRIREGRANGRTKWGRERGREEGIMMQSLLPYSVWYGGFPRVHKAQWPWSSVLLSHKYPHRSSLSYLDAVKCTCTCFLHVWSINEMYSDCLTKYCCSTLHCFFGPFPLLCDAYSSIPSWVAPFKVHYVFDPTELDFTDFLLV